jgi:hypothetical protein
MAAGGRLSRICRIGLLLTSSPAPSLGPLRRDRVMPSKPMMELSPSPIAASW